MAVQDKENIHLAIIGGGISGLCLALGISNHAPHIRIQVYESTPQLAGIGAGVSIGPNAQRALFKIDPRLEEAYEQLKPNNIDFDADATKALYMRFVMGFDHPTRHDSKAGNKICDIFCDGGIGSVHRARFLEQLASLLSERMERDSISFDAALVSIEDVDSDTGPTGVKLNFADGRTVMADAVIGCDGIRSPVRRVLLGGDSEAAQPAFTGKYVYRGLVPMDEAVAIMGEKSARNSVHRLGYDGHILTYPIDRGQTMNVVAFHSKADDTWPENSNWIQPASREEMHADFSDFSGEVHSLIDEMEKCDKWALFHHPPAETYHREGRVCLIGDAAHASTPHLGAAAGMAIEDAFVLSVLLGEVKDRDDLRKAFGAFEASRKIRTQRLVMDSRRQSEIYDLRAENVGDDIDMLAQTLPRGFQWVWDHNIEQELIEARVYMKHLS